MSEAELKSKIKELKEQIKGQDIIIKKKFGDIDKYKVAYDGLLTRQGICLLLEKFEENLKNVKTESEKKYILGVRNALRAVLNNNVGIIG